MLKDLGERAKSAERTLMTAGTLQKNLALKNISKLLRENISIIIEKNNSDLEKAKDRGMSEAMLDRLSLSEKRISAIADAVDEIAGLDDPCGKTVSGTTRPNGLRVQKVTVPIGVIAVIFEARPNVTVDAAALCLKSGNSVILRGGKEAIESNRIFTQIMRQALEISGLPKDCIQLVEDTSRKSAEELMKLKGYVDVLIPRGGAGLINSCVENASVPVIETGTGNCHIYVDKFADLEMSVNIIFNAKTSRPSVCNACESLVIHKDMAEKVLTLLNRKLSEKDVVIHGDERTCEILSNAVLANEEDFGKEYLGFEISVKIADSIEKACEHIMKYSTGHSEAIITESFQSAEYFTKNIDAAAVYVNASTRFTDGGELGFGAEIGISTQKLHARGPLGLSELTTMKYVIYGNGQIR